MILKNVKKMFILITAVSDTNTKRKKPKVNKENTKGDIPCHQKVIRKLMEK